MTVGDLVRESLVMWMSARSLYKAALGPTRTLEDIDDATCERIANAVARDHPQFCQAYPIVHRYMCYMRQYNALAFKEWLDDIAAHPWTSEDEYLAAQANYVRLLYIRACKISPTDAEGLSRGDQMRESVYAMLIEENKLFKREYELAAASVEQRHAASVDKNKAHLQNLVLCLGPNGMATAGHIRVDAGDLVCDLPPAEVPECSAHGATEFDISSAALLDD